MIMKIVSSPFYFKHNFSTKHILNLLHFFLSCPTFEFKFNCIKNDAEPILNLNTF